MTINKSVAIREYYAKHPTAGLTEIARALEPQGIKVSASHVKQALRNVLPAATKPATAKPAVAKPVAARPAVAKAAPVKTVRPKAVASAPAPVKVSRAPAVAKPAVATAVRTRAAKPASNSNVCEVIELARKFRDAVGSTGDAVKILHSLA
jgi:hypothetical protein